MRCVLRCLLTCISLLIAVLDASHQYVWSLGLNPQRQFDDLTIKHPKGSLNEQTLLTN